VIVPAIQSAIASSCCKPRDAFTPPGYALPALACDSHAHVFGPFQRFPLDENRSYTPEENSIERFRWHLSRLGLQRGGLVTASAYGLNNSILLDALGRYPDQLRGVAVADRHTSIATLIAWKETGVRGLRFNLYSISGQKIYRNGVGLEALEALAPGMREAGMHAQIWVHAPDLVELEPRFRALRVPVVIDHMGRMNVSYGADNPGFLRLCAMLADGVAWTKLSGADRNTGGQPGYRDIDGFAARLIAANPERLVWGSDWPHINYFKDSDVPDDGILLQALKRWLPDGTRRNAVLADNPATLYGFPML
jgi:predicted TIM-barrel fold metal-dependent hydrolase